MEKKLITVLIAVYMNEGSLHRTYIELKRILNQISEKYLYEIIFVNDGSTDNSLKEIKSIKEIDKCVRVINFTRNFGQVAAIHAGFDNAKGDIIVNISADMQDPVQLILQMLEKWEEGYMIVACERSSREDSFISKITSKLFYRIIKKSEHYMPVGGFDYFLLDRCVYENIAKSNQRNTFLQGDILWFGYTPYFIPYERQKRLLGKSMWNLWKKIKYFIDGVIYTSYLPIRLMSFIGIITSLLGLCYAVIVFIAWLLNETPFTGYAPIIITLLIVSGLIMIMLGIIGEYLWRTYDQVRGRPRYIVKED
ncbi:MAG: glycosyltransferase family 2 protein [Ignavibacteria bacterium]|jgi:dolichol-phosphate mannosyltransferase